MCYTFREFRPMPRTPYKWIEDELSKLKSQGLFINIRTIESPIESRVKVNGKWVLNFCTNNYLGLANNKLLKRAAKQAIDKYGIGPTAVRTIAGTTTLHLQLESELARFKKVDDVISLQSGFLANLATIPALVSEGDIILSDELNHASIIDACRLSKAEVVRYDHCNPKDLEEKIRSSKRNISKEKRKLLVVTDGVFSMDGDITPLDQIVKIAKKHNALLMVDDAHGEGVLGKGGRGIVDHFGLHGEVDIEVGTMSKAFGVVGGYVAGRKAIIDWLRQRARPYLFSSAMTASDTAACLAAVKIISKSPKRVEKLWQNTKYFKEKLTDVGFNTGKSQTPIIPVMLGEEKLAQEMSRKLFDKGIFTMAITYPTVALGKARIRMMMSAAHTQSDLDTALDALASVGRELNVIP